MWATALLYSGVAAVILAVVLCAFDFDDGDGIVSGIVTAVIYFVVMTGITAAWVYMASPVINGSSRWHIYLVYLVAMLVAAAIKWGVTDFDNFSMGTGAIGVMLVLWLIVGGYQSISNPWGQDQATHLANLVTIVKEKTGAYPETDTEHISLVPKEAAAFKADNALSQVTGKNTNLSTLYSVGDPNKQSINKHLYWVFPLHLGGTGAQRRVHYIVPGYILVDAENPEVASKLKLGYKMNYTPGARAKHSIKRLIHAKYPHYIIDDLTLEINDDWQPYFTAALSQPVYTFGPSMPKSMIVVDPDSGKITNYKLGHAPDWVDRIYSDGDAKKMLNWWGEWGAGPKAAPWKGLLTRESAANRYKVSGDPVLVYTKDKGGSHPEWQMIMTSYRSDNSATYVALFDARVAKVRLYQVPSLHTEAAAKKVFDSSSFAVKSKYESTEMALHSIYGRLTWVTGFINANDGEAAQNQSFQGIGLVAASSTQGGDVQAGPGKDDVLISYQEWLSSSQASDTPGADAKTLSVEGTVEHVSSVVRNGNTDFFLILKEHPTKVFRGNEDDHTLEISFVEVGHRVRISYLDHGGATLNIQALDDLELKVGAGN